MHLRRKMIEVGVGRGGERAGDDVGHACELHVAEPAGGQRRRADPQPGGDHRRPGIERHRVAVDRDTDGVEPVFALLIHSGGGQFGAHPPTPAGLRAYLDCLPPRNIVWSVSAKPGNLFATAAQAIQLGGHVSIGIGDHTYAELGTPTNAELVTRIVEIARACGRAVATPDEARRILGLDPR